MTCGQEVWTSYKCRDSWRTGQVLHELDLRHLIFINRNHWRFIWWELAFCKLVFWGDEPDSDEGDAADRRSRKAQVAVCRLAQK